MRVKLLAPETAGKAHLLAVRPDEAVRNAVHTAYHEPVFVKLAKPVIVQGTHDAGLNALSQENSALFDVLPSSVKKLPLCFIGTGHDPLPEIRPFYVSMVLEIAVAAIVRTPVAGEADLAGHPFIGIFHLGIETGQFSEQGVFHVCLESDRYLNSPDWSSVSKKLPISWLHLKTSPRPNIFELLFS